MWDEVKLYGHKYVTCNALLHGDYCGTGTVGEANIRALIDPDVAENSEYEQVSYAMFDRWRKQYTREEDELIWKEMLENHIRRPNEQGRPPRMLLVEYPYCTKQLWLLENDDENTDTIAALSDYPLVDEEVHSQVELDWEERAWDDWVRHDLWCALPEELQDKIDDQKPSDGKLFNAYRLAMEETNTYPTHEYSGTHVDVDKISEAYEQNIRYIVE